MHPPGAGKFTSLRVFCKKLLCEGDMTFRAADIEKLIAYAPHADIVNGTRTVEPLRAHKDRLERNPFRLC